MNVMIHVWDRVTPVRADDNFCDTTNFGKLGVVIGRVVDDHGASPKDPLLTVRFSDGAFDAYWETELELVRSWRSR